MKRVLRFVAIIAIIAVTFAVGMSAWLYFYTFDLPSISQLNEANPLHESEIRLRWCDGTEHTAIALPKKELGSYIVPALIAAEGRPDSRSPYVALYPNVEGPHVAIYQLYLARSLTCPDRPLRRMFEELRLANEINRKFGQQELLTIYLNRVYLGNETYGVQAGAQKFFGKPVSQLTLEQAVMIAGMIRSPSRFSPISHPDRAAERRNSILDEMVVQNSVLQADADRAKAVPIQVLR
jgi:membrane carboxypeptidase/penicillin-binding protein